MKKLIVILTCLFSSYIYADCCGTNVVETCPYKIYSSQLVKYYFSISQISIKKDSLYLNSQYKVIPLFQMVKDKKGYFTLLWKDNDYCPKCHIWSYSPSLKFCLNSACKNYPAN